MTNHRSCREGHCDVNIRNRDGETALIEACSADTNYNIVAHLLALGADPNIVSDDRETALTKAAMWGTPKMVSLLLEYDADVNPQATNNRDAPLESATSRFSSGTLLLSPRINHREPQSHLLVQVDSR